MSLARLVYYSAVIGGWAAFFGWLVAEVLILRGQGTRGGMLGLAMVGGIVAAAIGAGLNVVAGISNTNWKQLMMRVLSGLVAGGVGGALGILLGNVLYAYLGLPRVLGFMVLGLGVGVVDGLYERSISKIRNGVIGGLLGGLVGGLLFDPLAALIASGSGISSRATTFVVLGICIGALIGFAQVVLRDAWLTVLDGYRPGRQLILSQSVTILGRADHLPLPFIGPMNTNLDPEHLRILRQANGQYVVEDNKSKLGISVNHQVAKDPRMLADGDVIKLGTNFVRFNERRRKAGGGAPVSVSAANQAAASTAAVKPPPPPPGPKRPPVASPPATTSTASGGTPQSPPKPVAPTATKPPTLPPTVSPSAKPAPPGSPPKSSGLPPPPPPPKKLK